jgi:hypothetical protein
MLYVGFEVLWVVTPCNFERSPLFWTEISLPSSWSKSNLISLPCCILLLISCLAYLSTLKMEARCSSETSACLPTSQRYYSDVHAFTLMYFGYFIGENLIVRIGCKISYLGISWGGKPHLYFRVDILRIFSCFKLLGLLPVSIRIKLHLSTSALMYWNLMTETACASETPGTLTVPTGCKNPRAEWAAGFGK